MPEICSSDCQKKWLNPHYICRSDAERAIPVSEQNADATGRQIIYNGYIGLAVTVEITNRKRVRNARPQRNT